MQEEAFVLINSETGKEVALAQSLREIPEVYNVVGVYGVYDLVVRVRTSGQGKLEEAVSKIRSIPLVKSTLTMMVIQN